MTRTHLAILLLSAFALTQSAVAGNAPNFKDYKGDEEFGKLLLSLPLIAEVGGGHLVKMTDGSLWLVGIGSTTLRDSSGSEVIRQQRVTRLKAQAAVVEFLNGSKVSAICVSRESTELRNENGKENAVVTESLDEVIVTQAKGMVASLEVIGTWTNLDGSIFFQAIGKKRK